MKRIIFMVFAFLLLIGVVNAVENGVPGTIQSISCTASTSVDRDKCCIDKGFTSYNSNLKICVFKYKEFDYEHGRIYNETLKAWENFNFTAHNMTLMHTEEHEEEHEHTDTIFNKTIIIKTRDDNETERHIVTIINKTRERNRVQIQKLENLTFTITKDGIVVASGKFDAKLFGFMKFKHKYFCHIAEDGSATRKHAIWDIFVADTNTDICGDKPNNSTTVPGTA